MEKANLTRLLPLVLPIAAVVLAICWVVSYFDPRRPHTDEEVRAETVARNVEQLRVANQNYLKSDQNKNPSGYLRAMVELSYAYNAANQNDKSKEVYQKALNYYLSEAGRDVDDNSARMLFDALRIFPPGYAKLLFSDVFKTIELRTKDSYSAQLEGSFLDSFTRSAEPSEIRKRLETAVSIRTAIRGKNASSLQSLLRQEANACESAGDIVAAEKINLDADALENAQDPSRKESQQFTLAQFYLRHSNFEKANAAWHKALAVSGGSLSQPRLFADLFEQYKRVGRAAEAEEIAYAALERWSDTSVGDFDPKLLSLYEGYIQSGALEKAKHLAQARVVASAKCISDESANDWRLKLSETCMALGQTEDSDRLFQQAKKSIELQGVPSNQLVNDRVALLNRLGRTDLANRLVASQPHPDTIPAVASEIRFRFTLLAQQEIQFGSNTSFNAIDSRSIPSPGPSNEPPEICCLGIIRKEGNFSFNGTIYKGPSNSEQRAPHHWKPMPRKPPNQPYPRLEGGYGPGGPGGPGGPFYPGGYEESTPSDVFPLPPARNAPAKARSLSTANAVLEAGDYTYGDSLRMAPMQMSHAGVVRIFLADSPGSPLVYECPPIISMNNPPANLQIWYSGTRKIRIGTFRGVIYAPNAVVELEFNGRLTGAIVANRIVGKGNNTYEYDVALKDKSI